MKTKIIPFDLETAKKIQAGEIEGRFINQDGLHARIVCFDKMGYRNIAALVKTKDIDGNEIESFMTYNNDGDGVHNTEDKLFIELTEEVPEEQHPIEESELYQAGYKVGFETGRCVAFDEKKGCAITLKHEFKPFDKVLVRYPDKTELYVSRYKWIPGIFQYKSINSNLYFVSGRAYRDCIPYEGNENLVGTIDKPKEK